MQSYKKYRFRRVGFLLGFLLCAGLHVFAQTAVRKHKAQYGTASFYSDSFNGQQTANGEVFSNDKMTAAHNTLPLGTYVKVTNRRNGKWVIVKITDRLFYKNPRLIDLSEAAARKLGFFKRGLTSVKVEVLPETMLHLLGIPAGDLAIDD